MMKKFNVSFSKQMLLSTVLVSGVMCAAVVYIIGRFCAAAVNGAEWWLALGALLILVSSFVYAFVSQSMYLGVDDKEVVIKKMVGSIVIERSSIQGVSPKKSLLSDIRLCGISGLFGHIGLFRSSSHGRYYAYAKDGGSLVLIRTVGKQYVVSCDKREEFIDSLTANRP